jgi:ATP:corrinoid adenosyltransferase
MGLTEVTSPLTRHVVRVADKPLHAVNVGTGVGRIVSDAGRTFRLIGAGMATMLFGALL